jgi:hypothetical protein
MVRRVRKDKAGICGVPQNAVIISHHGDVLFRRRSLVGTLDADLPFSVQDPKHNKAATLQTPKEVSLFPVPDNMADFKDTLTTSLAIT